MPAVHTGLTQHPVPELPLRAGNGLPLQRLVQHGPAVSSNRARVLVLVPTRELAEQVLQSFIAYGKGLDLRFLAAYGGVSINPQMMKLR